jgi:hypothetical protein
MFIKKVLAQDAVLPNYTGTNFKFANSSLGSIISAVLPYVYVAAGLSLLVLLIFGGFTIMTSSGEPGKIKQGSGMISSALIGFFIVFVSYLLVQLAELMLGVKIL